MGAHLTLSAEEVREAEMRVLDQHREDDKNIEIACCSDIRLRMREHVDKHTIDEVLRIIGVEHQRRYTAFLEGHSRDTAIKHGLIKKEAAKKMSHVLNTECVMRALGTTAEATNAFSGLNVCALCIKI